MERRAFVKTLSAGAGFVAASCIRGLHAQEAAQPSAPKGRFKLNYAPHLGMFEGHAGSDPIDQLRFMADQGFAAMEDNGMKGKPPELQERIRQDMDRLGMAMGVFIATGDFGSPTFVSGDEGTAERILNDMRASVEVARRVNAKWCTVVPGAYQPRMDPGYQTANCIELLKRCAEVCEPAGLVMVLEPLNPRDHPGLFLTAIPQAYQICRAVGSPSCKVLDDLYHQQVTEGNLIPNLDRAWSEIGYFQCGDNPGRKEPGTGEINYRNVFRHIHGKGYTGIVGMEHGNSIRGKEGEQAVIDAYVWADGF